MTTPRKLTLALLSGGTSAEREVSLASGRQALEALDRARYDVRPYDPRDDLPRLAREAADVDVALIILHGRHGEDGVIQGFLESLGIPYTCSGVLGSALAMNKVTTKQIYRAEGLPTPAFETALRGRPFDAPGAARRLGLPLVVKPEHEGSSIGLTIVRDPKEAPAALEKAYRFDRRALVEEYVAGVEITASVLGNENPEALPLIEIIPSAGYEFFDYDAKYTPGASEEICPARLPEDIAERARAYAVRAHEALSLRGCSRTDMIIRGGEATLLETNTIPGMTATSLLPRAARTAGIPFPRLLDRLIELALEGRGH